jgi:hypothetical protein
MRGTSETLPSSRAARQCVPWSPVNRDDSDRQAGR